MITQTPIQKNKPPEEIVIAPQAGPQKAFLHTPADIAIYGGAAGGGKTFALLLEPLRHINNKEFGGVIFRRNATQVRNEGGLWDESMKLYPLCGGKPFESTLDWSFPSGMRMKFAHLEHEKTVLSWQGSQIPYIGFDELTHFSDKQFWYMLSRNRSTSGVPGYVRATCNPDADSWVRRLVDWWIDEDGYPILERSGVIRYFVRFNDTIHWADSPQDLSTLFGPDLPPKSLTFINARLQDNQILMKKDPTYLANLLALPRVDRLRLEGGNWNIRLSAGTFFRREWFDVIETLPAGWTKCVRFWDRAATKPSEQNPDPDFTRGLKLYGYPDGTWVVANIISLRDTPLAVERVIRSTASQDGHAVKIVSQQDPGSAGVAEANHFVRMLNGYDVKTVVISKEKATRARPVSAQCEAGNVKLLKGPWVEDFLNELENFPEGAHDDQVDVLSGAYNELCEDVNSFDNL